MKKTATDIVIEVAKRCTTHEPADCDGCPFFSRKNCVRDRDLAVIDTLVDQRARIKELQEKLDTMKKEVKRDGKEDDTDLRRLYELRSDR